LGVARQEREILERAVRAVSEQAANAEALVDEAIAAGLGASAGQWAHRESAPHGEPAV
jgi:hypothetical protein